LDPYRGIPGSRSTRQDEVFDYSRSVVPEDLHTPYPGTWHRVHPAQPKSPPDPMGDLTYWFLATFIDRGWVEFKVTGSDSSPVELHFDDRFVGNIGALAKIVGGVGVSAMVLRWAWNRRFGRTEPMDGLSATSLILGGVAVSVFGLAWLAEEL
jgi:hypothetical protein